MENDQEESSAVDEVVLASEGAAAESNESDRNGAISISSGASGDNRIPPVSPHEEPPAEQHEPQEVRPPDPTSHQEGLNAFVVVERLPGGVDYSADVIVIDDTNGVPNQNQMVVSVPTEAPVEAPSSAKKRKRSHSKTPPKKLNLSEEDDDGSTCPICLDHWEMSGPHRLVSLKCGHLFGHSCIKRWISECVPGSKCCPSCKTKATNRDMRFLYAKKICAVDNTEEHRLRDLLEEEKRKNMKLLEDIKIQRLELAVAKNVMFKLETELEMLRKQGSTEAPKSMPVVKYTLFMEKNIEIAKKPGCRVMLFGENSGNLIVSQKSTQNLFSGYGVRFIDIKSFKPTHFLHMSTNSVRDLCFSSTEDLLISATMEKSAKLFNVRDRTVVSVFTPSDKALWACALDKELSNYLYLGSQHGSTYLHDIRYPSNVVEEFKNDGDLSPVINICPVPVSTNFPFGGFLVCKLQSLWFYEQTAAQEVASIRLNVEGPFISMSYDRNTNNVLISTRPSAKHVFSRYIVASLTKVNDITVLDSSVSIFNGSKVTPVMSRCTQIPIHDNTLIAAYLQDVKLLSVWDLRENSRIQSFPVTDIIFDTCPVYEKDKVFLAALTETKCRIYKITPTE